MRRRFQRIVTVANRVVVDTADKHRDIDYVSISLDLKEVENQVKYAREELVLIMRHNGWTWHEVAICLMITRQAAWEKYHELGRQDQGLTETQLEELREMSTPVSARSAPRIRPVLDRHLD